jgi:two-component system phosphate regulon response regulator PhoB
MPTKVFIIEDDVSLVRMYSIKLKREGFIVNSTLRGKNAVNLIEDFQPHIILLDIMLPDISGIEILKELKKNPKLKKIPVIMFTVLPEIIALKKAYELGAKWYFIKS